MEKAWSHVSEQEQILKFKFQAYMIPDKLQV